MLICKLCDYETNKISNYTRHLETNKHKRNENITKYYCETCNFKSDKYYNYERHLESAKHKGFSNIVNDKKIEIYICELCKKEYNIINELLEHKNTEHKYNNNKSIDNFEIEVNKLKEKYKNNVNTKKVYIPSALINLVWITYINENDRKGKCYCCCTEEISVSNFDCGHIISHSNGGMITLENLRPICGNCNKSMGFILVYEKLIILDNLYRDYQKKMNIKYFIYFII